MRKKLSSDEIERFDKNKLLSFYLDASKHYREATKLAEKVSIDFPKIQRIIIGGVGGSAIGGDLLKDWARDIVNLPIEVCREYSLPTYADNKSLVFILSFSGETEESLSLLLDALKRKCMIFCITSGGRLLEYAEKLNLPFLRIPSISPQPRAALPYLFLPLPIFLQKLGLTSHVQLEIKETVETLKRLKHQNLPNEPVETNFAKKLALNIFGTIPTVYGFGIYRGVAKRYKQEFNENSKILSRYEFFPDLNHNEIVGWKIPSEIKNCFSIILIRDVIEPLEIRMRIETTKKLLEKKTKVFEVWSVGETRLTKMLSTIFIGDLTSLYLAVLRGVDPTPVKVINKLKELISQSGIKQKILREIQAFQK